MRLPRLLASCTSVLALLVSAVPAVAQTKLLRFPDIHGERIVFTYAGDLWLAPATGGAATRLTAHPGVELFPKFSPDGAQIAFTAQYDGDEQVYVMPATGGEPRQLTFYPAVGPLTPRWGWDNQVYDWTPDGKAILFRSAWKGKEFSDTRLYTVPIDGGLAHELPMPKAGPGDFSPDGKRLAYSPMYRDFRSEKRYEGGWAQDLYIFDLASHDVVQITSHVRTDRDPMWIGDKIYFSSDRSGTLNLYVYDTASRSTEQLTKSTKWDVRWPSDDGRGRIVYELGGELEVYDIASERSTRVEIDVADDGLWKRPERVSAAGRIESYSISPKGERALFVARGEIFTAPIEKGPTRALTTTPGAHEKWARWSPDGAQIAFVSDETGEEEIWIVPQDGSGEPRQLTRGGRAMRYAPEWAPDGKRLAFSDKDGKIWVLELDTEKLTEVADERNGQVRDYAWAPDGRHLAFSLSNPAQFREIAIWSLEDGKTRRVTDGMFNAYGPTWDPEGKYLYYRSDREYSPQISAIEFNYATDRETSIFALALRKDVTHPFPPETDEVTVDEDEDEDEAEKAGRDKEKPDAEGDDDAADEATGKKNEDKAGKDKKKLEPVRIDFDGLASRVARVPIDADNYSGLVAIKGALLYTRSAPFYYGRDADIEASLRTFVFKDRKESTLAEDINGWAPSADGAKVLVRHGEKYKLYNTDPKQKDAKDVSTSGLMAVRVPAEEWPQIFDEVWRRYRDFFYVENMHGYDWDALGRQYRGLLEHVAHRSDLNYVIAEMIAELQIGHAYIAGGDYEIPDRPKVALPGADFDLDETAGRYRLSKIFRGQNEERRYRAPLTEIGVDAREGDYVLAIDGMDLRATDNPYELLRYRSDRPVRLTLNGKPEKEGAREVEFNPITDEHPLRYLDWVEANRRRVDELSDGRIGYLHIPDMGAEGIYEFIKWYYPQIRKEALVVDVRSNGGGNVSQMIIERLRRKLLGVRFSRTFDDPATYPDAVFNGPMVCLLNEESASDGDIFPHRFRDAGLGPLIGKRSWGGVIGITGHGPLVDGGNVSVPQFGTNSLDGSWIIEGHGVDPDIVVENDPKSVIEGRDPQLERGVEELLKKLRAEPRPMPKRPADPVKTR